MWFMETMEDSRSPSPILVQSLIWEWEKEMALNSYLVKMKISVSEVKDRSERKCWSWWLEGCGHLYYGQNFLCKCPVERIVKATPLPSKKTSFKSMDNRNITLRINGWMKYVEGSGQRWEDFSKQNSKIIQCFHSKIVRRKSRWKSL